MVVAVLISAIRQRRSGAQIIGVSMAPGDTSVRHAVQALPLNPGQDVSKPRSPDSHEGPGKSRALRGRRALGLWRELQFSIRSYVALRSIDQLVAAGSQQLLDVWGPWAHPYTTFRWTLLSRLAGTEMALPSVGAGPITSRMSRFLIRRLVEWATFVSVRDEDSARELRAIGVRRELAVCPDMGWAYARSDPRVDPPEGATAVVGLSVMPYQDPRYWPNSDQSRYDTYMTKMATFVADLLQHGDRVLLFSSQTRADRLVAEDLRRDLGELADHPRLEWAVDRIETVEQLVETVSRCDYVVAARFHSVLLPLSLGIPTIGLAYQPKTFELLAQVGRSAHGFDIDSFEVGELETALKKLRAEDGADERAELLGHVGRFRDAVEAQFDLLFPARA
jgi:polysaccharide pyruvyl transferase WcaK-like protein